MADWVHCNSCFRQPGDGRKFSLTNCGHIYCQDCAQPGCQMVCKMCNNKCTTILLSSKMKPAVELFFTDPVDLIKKHKKQVLEIVANQKQLLEVFEFQKNHRKRLTAYIQETMMKQGTMAMKAHNSQQVIQENEKEIKLLKEENLYLKRLLKSHGGSRTPPVSLSNSPGHSSRGQRSSPSPTRSDTSPRALNLRRKSPYNHNTHAVQHTKSPYNQGAYATQYSKSPYGHNTHTVQHPKSPYDISAQSPLSSLVTTGRVLVRTPESLSGNYRVSSGASPSLHLLRGVSHRQTGGGGEGLSVTNARKSPFAGITGKAPPIPPNFTMPITPMVSVQSLESPISSPMETGRESPARHIGTGVGQMPSIYPSRLR